MKTGLGRMMALLPSIMLATAAFADQTTLRLGYQTGDISTGTMFAESTHLFEKHDLKVELVPFPAGPAMLPALAAAQIDLAWMGEFPVVTGYANGMPIEMIFVDRLNTTNTRLVARLDSGINSLKDLKGKRIAVSIGSTSHQHVLRALKMAGLEQKDVTLVNLQPGNMPAAYETGQVDAAFTWEPNIGIMQKYGGKVIATTQSLDDITGIELVARSEFTKSHPELVQRFLSVWEEALAAEKKDPDAVRKYEADRLKMTVAQFDTMWTGMGAVQPTYKQELTQDYLGASDQKMNSRMMKHLEDIGEFLLAEKRITALPTDWSKIINTQPLQTYVSGKPD